jgi:hypothetical protein
MQTVKLSRITMLILALVITVLAAACSPSASPTAAPSGGDTNTTTSGSDDPTAPVKGLYDALYAGGEVASFVCNAAGVDKAQLEAGYKSAADALTASGAKVDTSGLTYTASNVTADKATVTVGGKLSLDMAGTKTDSPMPDTPINVVKEADGWKICA